MPTVSHSCTMFNLLGFLKWLGIQGLAIATGIPMGLFLGLGAVLSPLKTLRRKDRRTVAIADPLPGLVHETVTVNDTRLHLVRTCTNADSAKPLLLLLHGFPEGWFSWRHQMEGLSKEGWSVAALDMRGYGDSDKPQDIASYRMGQLVGDVAGVIKAIAPPSTGRVALAGHDWGGLVAWHVAHAHPELVEKLAVLCFPHPLRFKFGQMGLGQLLRVSYVFAFQLPWLPELLLMAGDYGIFDEMFTQGPTACKRAGAVSQEDIERCKVAFSRPGAVSGALNYYRALIDEATLHPDPHMQQCLRHPLTMPVLLVWAEDDPVLRPQLLRGTERHVERLRVHTLHDCSHWAQQDRPEEVNRILLEFLQERTEN